MINMIHTQYIIGVQPSMVIHWNTVSMANPMLSKLVMPLFGPFQPSRHTPSAHLFASVLFQLQGTSFPPSSTTVPIPNYRHSNASFFIIRELEKILANNVFEVNTAIFFSNCHIFSAEFES